MAPRKATTAAPKTAKQTTTAKKTAADKESNGTSKPIAKPAAKKIAPAQNPTAAASKEVTKKEPATKKVAAATKKGAANKKPTAAAMKDTPKTPAAEEAIGSKKRKAEEDGEVEEPKANTSKRRKNDEEPAVEAPPAKRPATAAKKPKTVKPKAVINHIPTQRYDIYVSGEGSQGELGLGAGKGSMNALKPRLNTQLSAADVGVVQLATGGMHCAALTHDNKILTWGVNDEGALGRDTEWDGGLVDVDDNKSDDSSDDAELNPREATPTPVEFADLPEGTVFTQVAAGDSTTFALTDTGQVYGWGTFRVSLTPTHLTTH